MQDLIHTTAGFLNEALLKIPNRRFLPDCLKQSVVGGGNLNESGCRLNKIQGSSIAFDEKQSQRAALGEFVERYAAGHYRSEDFVVGSMTDLSHEHRLLDETCFRYYNRAQYRQLQAYGIRALERDDVIEWTEAVDYLSGESYLLPAFCVYMPYQSALKDAAEYWVGATSTGIAAGMNLTQTLVSGFCECAERHAFAQFWYRQEHIHYKQYSSKLICEHYKRDRDMMKVFKNPRVMLKAFDLSTFRPSNAWWFSCISTIRVGAINL